MDNLLRISFINNEELFQGMSRRRIFVSTDDQIAKTPLGIMPILVLRLIYNTNCGIGYMEILYTSHHMTVCKHLLEQKSFHMVLISAYDDMLTEDYSSESTTVLNHTIVCITELRAYTGSTADVKIFVVRSRKYHSNQFIVENINVISLKKH